MARTSGIEAALTLGSCLRLAGVVLLHQALGIELLSSRFRHGELLAVNLDLLFLFGLLLRGRIGLGIVVFRLLLVLFLGCSGCGVGIRQACRLFQFVHSKYSS
jgi:hypothetical protein